MDEERGDWRQQQEIEEQRWLESVRALNEAKRKGLSEESLKTLCFECGIPYKFVTEEIRHAA